MPCYTLATDLGTIHIHTQDRTQVVRLAQSLRAQRVDHFLGNQDDADLVSYFEADSIDAPQFVGTEYAGGAQ